MLERPAAARVRFRVMLCLRRSFSDCCSSLLFDIASSRVSAGRKETKKAEYMIYGSLNLLEDIVLDILVAFGRSNDAARKSGWDASNPLLNCILSMLDLS